MTKILDYFPKGMTPRNDQSDILNAIEEEYESYDKFLICAPTGSGKSAIAYTLANWLHDTGIVTSTKTLQDQYSLSFSKLPVIKGKSNFKCKYLAEEAEMKKLYGKKHETQARMDSFTESMGNILTETDDYYIKNKFTCDFGPCTKERGNKNKECEYKAYDCDYYIQRDFGLNSDICVMNYAFLFTMLNMRVPLNGVERENMIYDEAHKIEDELLGYCSMDIPQKLTKDLECKKSMYCNNVDELLSIVRDLTERCKGKSQQLIDVQQFTESNKYISRFSRLQDLYNLIVYEPENYVWETKAFMGKNQSLRIQPITVNKTAKKFLNSSKQFFMSGTLSRPALCSSLGFDQSEVLGLEIDKFAIPFKNRKVNFHNFCEMRFGMPKEDYLDSIGWMDDIASQHPEERGLILINKKTVYDDIMDIFSPKNAMRVIEGHAQNEDGTNAQDSLERLKESSNGILVSASMWEGVDLKDDLARWCVIYKCPYPYMGDMRVKQIMKVNKSWYGMKTVAKILQGLGRCVRSETDYAAIYCVDTKIKQTLEKNKRFIPAAYLDILDNED